MALKSKGYLIADPSRDSPNRIWSYIGHEVYDGAVYIHQGKTYLVKELDISSKIALCQLADLKFYTKTRDYTDVHVIGGKIAYPARISNIQLSRTTSQVSTCKVTTTWFGFYRIWRGSNQIFDAVDLLLPTYSYESQVFMFTHPKYSITRSNQRYMKLQFEMPNDTGSALVHGASLDLRNIYLHGNKMELDRYLVQW